MAPARWAKERFGSKMINGSGTTMAIIEPTLGMKFRRKESRPKSAAILTSQAKSTIATSEPVTNDITVFSEIYDFTEASISMATWKS